MTTENVAAPVGAPPVTNGPPRSRPPMTAPSTKGGPPPMGPATGQSFQSQDVNISGWNDPANDIFHSLPAAPGSAPVSRRLRSKHKRPNSAGPGMILQPESTSTNCTIGSIQPPVAALDTQNTVEAEWSPERFVDELGKLVGRLDGSDERMQEDIKSRVQHLLDIEQVKSMQESIAKRLAVFTHGLSTTDKSLCLKVTQELSLVHFEDHGKWITGLTRLVKQAM